MSEEIKKPQPLRKISIEVESNSYDIEYPKTGQFLQLESMKISMSGGNYNAIALGDTVSSQMSRYLTDMIAFFSICCPQMKKDLKVDTFSDLDMLTSKKLLKLYIDKILPWLQAWEVLLNSDDSEITEEKTN